jgi:hypothetical protein
MFQNARKNEPAEMNYADGEIVLLHGISSTPTVKSFCRTASRLRRRRNRFAARHLVHAGGEIVFLHGISSTPTAKSFCRTASRSRRR